MLYDGSCMGDNKAEGDEGTIYQFRKATCITIFFVSSESIGHHTPGNFEAIWLPAKVTKLENNHQSTTVTGNAYFDLVNKQQRQTKVKCMLLVVFYQQ